ncbi:hypothetical protein ccbrp13_71770 [Ktedonobacteria bacterium brp13]|nr:hypothetical protein ccbrp13_71770 [Ktedonobacteria bacterium brp13]
MVSEHMPFTYAHKGGDNDEQQFQAKLAARRSVLAGDALLFSGDPGRGSGHRRRLNLFVLWLGKCRSNSVC